MAALLAEILRKALDVLHTWILGLAARDLLNGAPRDSAAGCDLRPGAFLGFELGEYVGEHGICHTGEGIPKLG